MKRLATRFWRWLTLPNALYQRAQAANELADYHRADAVHSRKRMNFLAAQLVQVRVHQSRVKRAGWEVMCFIPEEVLECFGPDRNPSNSPKLYQAIEQVTNKLVTCALAGINRIDAQGKVTALIFAPLSLRSPADEPRYVQAVFEKDGKYKMHEKLWDGRSEEQRVKSAAGCGGYGV